MSAVGRPSDSRRNPFTLRRYRSKRIRLDTFLASSVSYGVPMSAVPPESSSRTSRSELAVLASSVSYGIPRFAFPPEVLASSVSYGGVVPNYVLQLDSTLPNKYLYIRGNQYVLAKLSLKHNLASSLIFDNQCFMCYSGDTVIYTLHYIYSTVIYT